MILRRITISPRKWEKVESRRFYAEELSKIEDARVVRNVYNLQVSFKVTGKGEYRLPLWESSYLQVGDIIDPSTCLLVTISKKGVGEYKAVEVPHGVQGSPPPVPMCTIP